MKKTNFHIAGAPIYKRHAGLFAGLSVFTLLGIVFETVSLGTIIPLVNVILDKTPVPESYGFIVSALYGLLDRFNSIHPFIVLCAFYLVLAVCKVVSTVMRDVIRTLLTQKILLNCQKDIYQKIIYSDLRFFIQNKSGDLVFRVINLPREISTYFTLLPEILVESINIAFLCVFLFTISHELFAGMVIVGFIYSLVIWGLSKNIFYKIGKEIPAVLSRQNTIANESFGGIRDIMTYGKRKEWAEHFFAQSEKYYYFRSRASVLRLIPGQSLELLMAVGMCGLGIYFARYRFSELLSVMPVLAVYGMALVKMIPSFGRIGQERIHLVTYTPSVKLFEELLTEKTQSRPEAGRMFESFSSEIRFADVSFFYRSGKPIFERLNLSIPCNKTIAVVGGSGSGKSTLIDLLLGLYEIEEGRITVDGVDIREYSLSSWRSRIGVVSQNSFIFNASVKENIAFDFTHIDMDRIKKAAQAAGCDEFISQLKSGYDTELGDRGYMLSGGQRQRIAIARALYRNPEIIIFDEATSALDYRTERMISETVAFLSRSKTIIILAHRLSTIENADIIYVLKDGKITQQGTHAQLLKEEGEYTELYKKESLSTT